MTAFLIIALIFTGLTFAVDLLGLFAGDADHGAICLLNLPGMVMAIVALAIALGRIA